MSDSPSPVRTRRRRRLKHRGWRKPRYALIAAVAIWTIVATVLISRGVSDEFARPLGPVLVRSASPSGFARLEPPNPDPSGSATASQPVCGGPPQMIILLVGADTKTTEYVRGLADTIRVVRFDFVASTISVLAVPRALWVSAPALYTYRGHLQTYFGRALDTENKPLDQAGAYSMLNTTYFYGNLYELPGGGPSVLADTLYVNLGTPIEHYAAVNETVVVDMINEMDGVDIDVPYAVAGYLPGPQHMTGEQTLAYARTRMSDDDWHRVDRQNIALRAMWDKMTSPVNVPRIPGLIDHFINGAQTDLSKAQISSLVCLLTSVTQQNVYYYNISPSMVRVASTERGFFILIPDKEKIAPIVRQFLGAQ